MADADATPLRLAPPWLDRLMGFIYPFSLGLNEALAQLCLRSWLVISSSCGNATDGSTCQHWTLFTFLTVWVITSLACVPYLFIVFRR